MKRKRAHFITFSKALFTPFLFFSFLPYISFSLSTQEIWKVEKSPHVSSYTRVQSKKSEMVRLFSRVKIGLICHWKCCVASQQKEKKETLEFPMEIILLLWNGWIFGKKLYLRLWRALVHKHNIYCMKHTKVTTLIAIQHFYILNTHSWSFFCHRFLLSHQTKACSYPHTKYGFLHNMRTL